MAPKDETSALDRAAAATVEAERERIRSEMIERVEARMRLLGLNPFSTAKKAGLGGDYVRDLIRGKVKNPSTERLGKLAEALECSLYYLLGHEELPRRYMSQTPDGGAQEVPPPPPPLASLPASSEHRSAQMLPIRFEIMAETFRKSTDVVRPPIGYEAATIPRDYQGRRVWWEIIRDDSVASVAPPGSLVLVVEMRDDERELISHGEFVIVTKRFVGPDAVFHMQERSMRRVNFRYPDLGLWFLDFAHIDPDRDITDDMWKSGPPVQPAKTARQRAADEGPESLAAYDAWADDLSAAIDKARAQPDHEQRMDKALAYIDSPEAKESLEAYRKWRPRLEGKVIRVLRPLDSKSGYLPG